MKKIFLMLLILFQINILYSQIPNYVPSNGLVAWWPFTGNALDSSGNGNHGTVNGATLTTDRFGNANSAYYYSSSGCATRIDATVNTSSIQTGLTIAIWVCKIGNGCISPRLFEFWGNNGPGTAQWGWGTSSIIGMGSTTSSSFNCNQTVPAKPNNQWTHLVYTNDGINGKFYQDGVLMGTVASSGNPILASSLAIGRMNHPAWDAFNGKLDDMGVWNRALSSCEVQALYSGVVSNPPSNLIAQDTIKACGDSVLISATSGLASYSWSNGKTTASIYAKSTGWYKVTATNSSGCSGNDSVFVSILKANILNNDTAICVGQTVKLNTDSVLGSTSLSSCAPLPSNLQNGLVGYWPFCGNAFDVSGNGNHGTVNGATLTTDKYSFFNAAYFLDGTSQTIDFLSPFLGGGQINNFTISTRIKLNTITNSPNIWGKTYNWGEINFLIENNGTISFIFANNITGNKYSLIKSNSGIIQSNIWYDITICFNNGSAQIYLNGSPITTNLQWVAQGGSLISSSQIETSCNFAQHLNSSKIGLRYTGGIPGNYLYGIIDEFLIWNRVLTNLEIQQLYTPVYSQNYLWSTGDTTPTINVTPNVTTKYWVRVSNGSHFCTDTVTVTVSTPPSNLIIQDTIKACGDSVLVSATSGLASYSWSNGKTTASIYAKSTGWYRVTASPSAGCPVTDSVFVSILKANILNNDTAICAGQSVKLSADSILAGAQFTQCAPLPSNLQNGLVGYWPFCGNANDMSGNGNNGTVMGGVSLTSDRFGTLNSAYSFPGNSSSYIDCGSSASLKIKRAISFSAWILMDGGYYNPRILSYEGANHTQYSMSATGTSNSNRKIDALYVGSNGIGAGFCCGTGGNGITATSLLWNHLVFTMDSFGTAKLYLNSNLINTHIGSAVLDSNFNNSFNIGRKSYSAFDAWGGKLDDIAIWNRALSASEVAQLYQTSAYATTYLWSTGDTTPTINVTPNVTTKYWLRVSNGSHFCTDTVTVTVSTPPSNLIAQDTIKACEDSVLISATTGLASYSWSNGKTTASIYAKSTGWYKVTATNSAGCPGTDSVFVSIIKANIQNNDTAICAGQSVKLSADSILAGAQFAQCAPLPSNLQNGLVGYWPFCGNANDMSGNGNHGTIQGTIQSTTDRHGNTNSAYLWTSPNFNSNDYINIGNLNSKLSNKISISVWVLMNCSLSNQRIISTGEQGIIINQTQGSNIILKSCYDRAGCIWPSNHLISKDDWHHVVFVADSQQNFSRFYVDGVLTDTNVGGSGNQSSALWNIGRKSISAFDGYCGKIDDIGIWNRALSPQEVQQLYTSSYPQTYLWSNGDTTPTINVTPSTTTKYWVRVSNGSHFCTDTVTVTVSTPPSNLIAQDTIKTCGDSVLVSATSGLASYSWSNGKATASFFAKATGWYKVTAMNSAGCPGTDSVFVSILKAKILNNDTAICAGQSVKLSADSILAGAQFAQCAPLPSNLQNGLVGYWPFCGNANDMSGNGNHGNAQNGTFLSKDRFGHLNSAYFFDGIDDKISIGAINNITKFSISFWHKRINDNNLTYPIGLGINNLNTVDLFKGYGVGIFQNTSIPCGASANLIIANDGLNTCGNRVGNIASILNRWENITLVSNISSASLYVNGVLSESNNNIQIPGILNLVAGTRSDDFAYFTGFIDDITIWDRVLSHQEIQQLYTPAYPQTYLWSTGDTTPTINVTPSVTTKYWVRVSNGSHFCTDTVTVTVNNKTFSTINQSICQGQSFLGRNATGTYIDTLIGANSKSCDSIRTLILSVNAKTFSTINQTICQGQSFLGRNTSGTYIDTLIGANSKGCDSIRTLNLTVNNKTFSTINQTICQGNSFLGRTTSGTYIDTLIGANSKGCDSIRTLKLTVINKTFSTINQTICEGQKYLGKFSSGSYVDTFYGANSLGCDSIRTLNLTVNPKTYSLFNKTICQGDSFFGKRTSGVYIDTFYSMNSRGCDSIRTINLSVTNITTPIASDSQVFCNSAKIKDIQISGSPIKWYQDSMKNKSLLDTIQLIENGTYYATVSINNCESSYKKIKTFINLGSIVSDKPTYCIGDTISLTFQSFYDKIVWFNGIISKNIKLIASQSRIYTADYTYRKKQCSSDIDIKVYPIPTKPIATSPQTFDNGNNLNDLIVSGNNLYWFEDSLLKKNLSNTTLLQNEKVYYVTQRINDCESEAVPIKTILDIKMQLDSIYINNSMSPNNDQIMDAFTIDNIYLAKNNKIQIANRWGELVYEKENYLNDWYGEYLTNGFTNNTLPDGVYYYVFSFMINGQKFEKTGYIYIKK